MSDAKPQVLFVTSNRIGDCVISSGVIREIGRQIPGAAITVACGRPPAPLFRAAPGVERIIILDKKKLAGHWIELWKQAVGTRWDLVIDIRGSALSYLIPARRRVSSSRSRPARYAPSRSRYCGRHCGSPRLVSSSRTFVSPRSA